jgi:Ser/Thr protein kinase RdoA (MazF antagonist)
VSVRGATVGAMTREPAPDLRLWCERLGLGAVGTVRELTAGRSGARVLSVGTAAGRVVVKVTTDPGRLERARREIDVLRHLAEHPVPCAPTLVGAMATPDTVALALAEAAPLPAARDLGGRDWEALAVAVAEVHRVRGAQSLGLPASRPDLPGALPTVLEHGDCHLDNAVRDGTGRMLLVDWQEARLGDGLPDLVFAWQRAEFAGSRPPRAAMTEAYADARGLDAAALVPLLDRAELRLLREAWPPFLALGDDAGRAVLEQRLARLTTTIDGHDERPA